MVTGAGMLLGTAAYMSPEQARGRPADRRSDIWAFGCVLFEMLTGTRAFGGDGVSDTLASVLRADPDWNLLSASTSGAIRRLLRRCLEKNARRRIDSAAVVRMEIEDALEAPHATTSTVPLLIAERPRWRRAIPLVMTAILGVTAGAGLFSVRPSVSASISVTRLPLILGEGEKFTNLNRQSVAISSDGTLIAYVANQRLYIRSMSRIETRPMAGTDGAIHPVFSPDGRFIVFWSSVDLALKKIGVDSGTAVTLCPAENPSGMSWDGDGIVFGQRGAGIMRVSANGGKPDVLVRVNDDQLVYGPQLLPGGQAVLFTLANAADGDLAWDKAHIVVQLLESGTRKTLVDGGADAHYVPSGHLVYAVNGTLLAVPIDVRRLEVTGGPTPIVEGVRTNRVTGATQFSFSNNGSLIYIPGPHVTVSARTLVVIDRKGVLEGLKLLPGPYEFPRISPDGTQLAFGSDDGKEADIWIYKLSGASAPRRLTFRGRNRFPIWTSDGQHVAFQSDRDGDPAIFWQRADGTGVAERLTTPAAGIAHVPDSWSPNGNQFLFSEVKGSTFSLWTWSLPSKTATPFGEVQSPLPPNAVFSPDGKWVAYQAGEVFKNAVYVQPFPATGVTYQISKGLAHEPLWSRDGNELFYSSARGGIVAARVTMKPTFTFDQPTALPASWSTGGPTSERRIDITPDGKLVKVITAEESTDIAGPLQIQVVLNWFEELKRLAPVH
jgi:serine/threonine-protein kinase